VGISATQLHISTSIYNFSHRNN